MRETWALAFIQDKTGQTLVDGSPWAFRSKQIAFLHRKFVPRAAASANLR